MKKFQNLSFLLLFLSLISNATPPNPPLSISNNTTESVNKISTPPAPTLNIPPPKSLKEAIDRIQDYLIFKEIVPPVIDKEQLKREFFGKYTPFIEKLLLNKTSTENTKVSSVETLENLKNIRYIDFSHQENFNSSGKELKNISKKTYNKQDIIERENKKEPVSNIETNNINFLQLFLVVLVTILILLLVIVRRFKY